MNESIHPLRRWLFEHQETLAEFAARSGVTQGFLSEIINRKKRPSMGTIEKITLATDRAVLANDFQNIPEDAT